MSGQAQIRTEAFAGEIRARISLSKNTVIKLDETIIMNKNSRGGFFFPGRAFSFFFFFVFFLPQLELMAALS